MLVSVYDNSNKLPQAPSVPPGVYLEENIPTNKQINTLYNLLKWVNLKKEKKHNTEFPECL